MPIKSIVIEQVHKSGFSVYGNEGNCHTKTLPHLSVVQALEGSYDITLGEGATCTTGCGGFFIAPADVRQTIVHHENPGTGRMQARWVFMSVLLDGDCRLEDAFSFPTLLPEEHKAEMNALFEQIFASDDPFDEYAGYYAIVRLLSRVARPNVQPTAPCLREVMPYIRRHFREKLTVESLATLAHLSPSQFHAVFKRAIGISPIAYLNSYRLSLAADRLINTEQSVAEIARSVGLDDLSYFNKLFRKAYQISPTGYRQAYRKSLDFSSGVLYNQA